ncbi:hypothetical protein HGA34_04415 [Candidatus Falkowbacteria bacterium]|nr:hypothetical protein [Candidatus Falkowbacteria bacterium]
MVVKKTEETKAHPKTRKRITVKKIKTTHKSASLRSKIKPEAEENEVVVTPREEVAIKKENAAPQPAPAPVSAPVEAVITPTKPAEPVNLAGKHSIPLVRSPHQPGVTAEIAPATLAEKQSVIRSYLSGLDHTESQQADYGPKPAGNASKPLGFEQALEQRPKFDPLRAVSSTKDVPAMLKQSTNGGHSIPLYRKISYSFGFLVIVFLGILGYSFVGKLDVKVTPKQTTVTSNLVADIYNGDAAVKDSGVAGLVRQAGIEQSKEVETTGKLVSGEELIGKATIVNNYNESQPLVATTRLLSADGKLYRIKDTVTVPASGSIDVAIYADEQKAENVVQPTKFTIPGLWAGLQDKIYAENKEATVYQEKATKIVDQSDIDKAVEELKLTLAKQAENQLSPDEKNKFNQFLYKLDDNSITFEADGKAGDEREKINVKVKGVVSIVAFSDDKIKQLAKDKLGAYLGDNKTLVNFNENKLTYGLSNVDVKQNIASINVAFEGDVITKNDAVIDKTKLVGLTKAQLESYLGSLPEVEKYEIKFSPSFINKAPITDKRIKVEVAR